MIAMGYHIMDTHGTHHAKLIQKRIKKVKSEWFVKKTR